MNLLFILSILVLVAAFTCAGKGFRNLEIQYDFDQPNVERNDMVRPGLANVSGEVTPAEEELIAPFSEEPCVMFGIVVEEKHQQGSGPLWQISTTAQNGVPFYLEDDAGAILVDPDGITFDLPHKNVFEVPNGVVPPDPIRRVGEKLYEEEPDWADDLDLNTMTCLTSRDTRFYEYYLEPGEECHVFGSVMRREDGRNACYDDGDSLVVYQNAITPEFVLSDTPQGNDVKASILVAPWMIIAFIFLVAGLLGMAGSLA